MINGITSYAESAETIYLSNQIKSVSPSKFQGCSKSMLFLGCGDGTALNRLAREYSDWSFVGVDFNQSYISLANRTKPSNVEYICSSFESLTLNDTFGVIASPGLLSWVEEDALNAVFDLLSTNLEEGGYASFGFDNQFFWSELAPIRETFLANLLETGDSNLALMMIRSLVTSMSFSSDLKKKVAQDMVTDRNQIKHWLLQPTWRPFFPSDIIFRMFKVGLKQVSDKSLCDISIESLISPEIYTHLEFTKK